MKELEVAKDAVLDDVVEELINEREKGNQACANFDGVMLYSDDVTLDSAYQALWGCSQEDFEYQYDGARLRNGMRGRLAVTIENVLRNVKVSKLLFLTKNGKWYCPMAEEYIEDMEKYSEYCVPKKQNGWNKLIRKTVYGTGQLSDQDYIKYLLAFEMSGRVMKAHAEGKTWEEIKEMVESVDPDDELLAYIESILLDFSSIGEEYTNVNVEPKKTTKK